MSRVLVYLGRFAVIILGYAAAALAASAFLHFLFLGSRGSVVHELQAVAADPFAFSIPFVALFVAYFAFMPSAALILLAEMLGRRDWLSHALGGAVVAAAVIGLFRLGAEPGPGDDLAATGQGVGPVAMLIGAGIVGGLGYWLVAGRFAGNWRARTRRAATVNEPAPESGSDASE